MSAKDVRFRPMPAIACCEASISLPNAVRVTLGPKGRNVVIEKSFGAPRITKDGVAVAKEIELADKFENLGAQLIREVASKQMTSPAMEPPRRRSSPLRLSGKAQGGRRRPEPDGSEARYRSRR